MAFIALRDYLVEHFHGKRASGGKECIIRCPYCGDSKDKNKAHLYIGLHRQNQAIVFNCFKCNTGGSIGIDFFRTLGIYDTDLINLVLQHNSALGLDTSLSRRFITNYSHIPENTIIPIYDNEEYAKKLSYINRRIGTHYTYHDLQNYRIILNLRDYLESNGIQVYSRHPMIVDQLAFGFVGFLSVDNTHIILRRVVPEEKVHESIRTRYVNYTINDHGYAFFCIREGLDMLVPNTIHIAEGPFDALSIHDNLLSFQMNKLVFSSNGKEGLDTVLKYLIWVKKMQFFNTTFHIYIDNDITPYDMIAYRNLMNSLGLTYCFHSNKFSGEKDYGVPCDRIIDTII